MELPFLWFKQPPPSKRDSKQGGADALHTPTKKRQVERLNRQFKSLHTAIDAKRAALVTSGSGVTPEKVLVFETIGPVRDFFRAMRNSDLHWLFETVTDDIAPDDDFFNTKDATKTLGGRVYIAMTDQRAIYQLLSFWNRWQRGRKQKRGFAPFNQLFAQTKNVRYWDASDRIGTDVQTYWQERLDANDEEIDFEVEFVFATNSGVRTRYANRVTTLANGVGGQVLHTTAIPEIQYHAALVRLPAAAVRAFFDDLDNVALAQADEILYFRSTGQTVALTEGDAEAIDTESSEEDTPKPPIAALLDGLPANHIWLSPYLKIDDPDEWAAQYPARHRRHGTAMASLILHGDRGDTTEPPARALYVRPILRPDTDAFHDPKPEIVPRSELMVDLIYRAVVRLFESVEGLDPVAPDIRIINLSIGDAYRSFYREISPCARLLDWLSWRYGVLFVVSAGNQQQSIVLPISRADFRQLSGDDQRNAILNALYQDRAQRRIFAPAESINALTIGALHADHTNTTPVADVIDPVGEHQLPAALATIAAGVNRSIKPELRLPGGRAFYDLRLDGDGDRTELLPRLGLQPPGQKVAQPIGVDQMGAGYTAGSSNATALATRDLTRLFDEVVAQFEPEEPWSRLQEICLLKALMVHGASWGDDAQIWWDLLVANAVDGKQIREAVNAFVGYGFPDIHRVLGCTDRRATVLAVGSLKDDQKHVFSLPLPPELSGNTIERRLTVTLAWLTPCNPQWQRYRKASLWATYPTGNNNTLRVERTESNHNAVRRGTVQHEIMVNDIVVDYGDEAEIPIHVNCAADAGELFEDIPYALCVTLEVPESSSISTLYAALQTRIAPQVAIEN